MLPSLREVQDRSDRLPHGYLIARVRERGEGIEVVLSGARDTATADLPRLRGQGASFDRALAQALAGLRLH